MKTLINSICKVIALTLLVFDVNASVVKEYSESLEHTSYSLELSNCSMKLTVFDEGNINANVLSVKRTCSSSFVEQVGVFSVLFSTLKVDNKLEGIRTIAWGNISEDEVRNRLIQGSIKSPAWQRLLKRQGERKFKKTTPEIKEILNSFDVYLELTVILDAMGFQASVLSTDGVIVKEMDSGEIVPYDALIWFSIKPN